MRRGERGRMSTEQPSYPDRERTRWQVTRQRAYTVPMTAPASTQPGRSARPGRNEPCYCGSGRKYKQCCLAKDDAEAAAARAAAKASEEVAATAEASSAEPTTRAAPPRAPKHQTHQPWKATTSKGFAPKNRMPRKAGGS